MQTKDERIWRTYKASQRTAFTEGGRIGSAWMITARRWRMPIRDIKASVARYRRLRDSRVSPPRGKQSS